MVDKLNGIHPKYKLTVNPKEGTAYNPVHDEVNETIATIIDVTIGKCGWLAYYDEYPFEVPSWNRLHTSTVYDVEVDEHGNVTITTRNTVYILTKIS